MFSLAEATKKLKYMVHFDITGSTGNDANFNSIQSKIRFQKKEKYLPTDNAEAPLSLKMIIKKVY